MKGGEVKLLLPLVLALTASAQYPDVRVTGKVTTCKI